MGHGSYHPVFWLHEWRRCEWMEMRLETVLQWPVDEYVTLIDGIRGKVPLAWAAESARKQLSLSI